ncbi:MFS transporter [Paenibacillus arenosi]|uniref:MFS transporter n=1 Tax=Paenibacillus arenosi TaxID=2774142 RepID=A0ABR9B116_9BACL|nr:MFS transporter [Paenibacillus arenosi]MBD8500086.1 MFS transporter [Paenibacillus arenosi]
MMELAREEVGIQQANTSLWRNRTFLGLFASYAVSLFGNMFHNIALNLWVLQTTGSAKQMSIIVISHLIVGVVFGSFAGTFADRIDRRVLMMFSNICRLVLVVGIAYVMTQPDVPFYVLVILTTLVAFAGVFHGPAFHSSLADIVGKEQIPQAIGIINIADNIIRVSGFALGGMAVALFGGVVAILIDAGAFLVSTLCLLVAGQFPRKRERSEGQKSSFIEDFREGFKVVWHNPYAKAGLILMPVLSCSFMSSFMIIQVMAVQVWHADGFVFGLIEASIPLGYLIGSIGIMLFSERLGRRGYWVIAGAIGMGPIFYLIAQAGSAVAALPLILIIGCLFAFSTLIINIMLRVEIDTSVQGRVFGILGSIIGVTPPVGIAICSAISDSYGPETALTASAIATLVVSVAAVAWNKPMRDYR